MLAVLVTLMVVAAVVLAVLAAYVWWRRGSPAGLPLAVLLLAVAWWSVTYAVELSTADLVARSRWGDLKYAGVATVAPAWLVFVLRYTGRDRLVGRRFLLALAVEPVAVMVVLGLDATHDLVRSYPADAAGQDLPVVETGPLFWLHLAYVNVMVLVATTVFVLSLARISRLYRRVALLLGVAALLPLLANALHNFAVGPFARIDLTPSVFTLSGAVLVWGLYRQRMVNLMPLARGLVVEQMRDPVLVLDAYGRIADANPAAAAALGRTPGELVGRRGDELLGGPAAARSDGVPGLTGVPGLPGVPPLPSVPGRPGVPAAAGEVELRVDGSVRHFEVSAQLLPDARGEAAGAVLVLRDVTSRRDDEARLRQLLAERTRIAAALQVSLTPQALPEVPGLCLAQRYRPAGDGREIGGDLLDVFGCGPGRWGVLVGDVSGKGAEAAAVTALVRYTVRALAVEGLGPSELLQRVNDTLLRESGPERFCTVAYAVAHSADGVVRLRLCLAGHPPPLLRAADATVRPVGRLGTALGLVPDPELHEVSLTLAPGELMLWFTDGLVEARRDGELYGDDRVVDVLREHRDGGAQALVDALQRAVHDFAGGSLADDLALLAVRVPPVAAGEGTT